MRHSSRGPTRHGNTSTSTETINIGASPTAACCAPELGLVEKASEAGIRQREAARYQSKAPDKLEMVSQSTKPLYNHGKVVTLSQLVAVGWQLCSFHSWWQIVKGPLKYFLRKPVPAQQGHGKGKPRALISFLLPAVCLESPRKPSRELQAPEFWSLPELQSSLPHAGSLRVCVCMSKELPSSHLKAMQVSAQIFKEKLLYGRQ